ncbi:MAG: hypothetical protein ACI9DM_002715 [Cyclobacteriaceae bacterium]|jgi:hypothetical protein
MAVTILEALQNAQYNLDNAQSMPVLMHLVKGQMKNAITLLEKGYTADELVEPLLEEYGDVESVPDKR